MKIVAVCGMGIGTSILLKMNIEKVLDSLDIEGDVEAADIGVAKGFGRTADIMLTSQDLAEEIGEVEATIIVIDNFFDLEEIESKLSTAINP
ncbi:PTS sugar transporter subunit IIB [Pengzhenrongella sp.]|uniref:PTS sugar transporter subunit IIB n=1 Tax=Pengzhenrongella sp. TaxID=2888820 RepID=UPI002F9418BB